MEKLRIDSGIKRIEVNDDGEYICIPINDASFYERFGNILKWFDDKQIDIERQVKEFSEKHQDDKETEGVNVEAAMDAINMYSNLCKEVCSQLDELFGEGCCRKVFPGIQSPDIELIWDFFEQINPILQKFAQERNQKINLKYNRNRKGARSK